MKDIFATRETHIWTIDMPLDPRGRGRGGRRKQRGGGVKEEEGGRDKEGG